MGSLMATAVSQDGSQGCTAKARHGLQAEHTLHRLV